MRILNTQLHELLAVFLQSFAKNIINGSDLLHRLNIFCSFTNAFRSIFSCRKSDSFWWYKNLCFNILTYIYWAQFRFARAKLYCFNILTYNLDIQRLHSLPSFEIRVCEHFVQSSVDSIKTHSCGSFCRVCLESRRSVLFWSHIPQSWGSQDRTCHSCWPHPIAL